VEIILRKAEAAAKVALNFVNDIISALVLNMQFYQTYLLYTKHIPCSFYQ